MDVLNGIAQFQAEAEETIHEDAKEKEMVEIPVQVMDNRILV